MIWATARQDATPFSYFDSEDMRDFFMDIEAGQS